ncbi:hypothetical protein K438DRAFT_1985224 [Mycena galopus ATCC 62051]|nr:hypothetical protein K438DRAFT_1985224 [Mycena galopus ATCC 62051]
MQELELDTVQARRQRVADQVAGVKFLYRDPTSKSGGYRGELVLRFFASFYLRLVLKSDGSFGLPIGGMTVCLAAKTGTLDNEGTGRKGKNPALRFIANPWAQRALRYLPPIQKLSDQKWREIYELASPFLDSDKGTPDDILTDGSSTDDSELAGGLYVDPRSAIIPWPFTHSLGIVTVRRRYGGAKSFMALDGTGRWTDTKTAVKGGEAGADSGAIYRFTYHLRLHCRRQFDVADRPSLRPPVDGTPVFTTVRRRDGGLRGPQAQRRDGTVVRPSVRPTVLDGYGDDPYHSFYQCSTTPHLDSEELYFRHAPYHHVSFLLMNLHQIISIVTNAFELLRYEFFFVWRNALRKSTKTI